MTTRWTTPTLRHLDLAEARGRWCHREHFGERRPVSYEAECANTETGEVRRIALCRQHATELAERHGIGLPEVITRLSLPSADDSPTRSQP